MIKLLGTDVSWWQGIIDFVKMKLAGAFYVIIRAGSCNSTTSECYSDYCVATNAMGAEDAVLSKGFYWYYREFGIEHAKEQARYFWDTIREWTIEEGLFCDVEVYNANLTSVYAFMEELQRLSGLPDKKLGIYSRGYLWSHLGGDYSKFKKFMCWVARYNLYIDHPWDTWPAGQMKPWDEYNYWQFSADGNGRGREFGVSGDDIDLDYKLVVESPIPPKYKVKIIAPKEVEIEVIYE